MSDLQAMESRLGVTGEGVSDVPQYKQLMMSGLAGQQQRYGLSRLRGAGAGGDSLNNLWQQYGAAGGAGQYGAAGAGGQYGGAGGSSQYSGAGVGAQSNFASRNGALAGACNAASNQNQFASYDYADYGDYTNMANMGGANRRFGNYDVYDYGGINRGYAGSSGSGLGVGYGGYSPVSVVSGYGPSVCEDKGLNPALVLATLAGAALAFFIIYRQITTGGKRNLTPTPDEFLNYLANLVWSGE